LFHSPILAPVNAPFPVPDAEHFAARPRIVFVTAVNQGAATPAAMAFVQGLNRLFARWVEQADEPEQDQVFRQVGRSEAARSNAGTLEPREPQHALALAGELVGGGHEVCAIDRLRLSSSGLLSVAVLNDDF